MGMYWVVAYIWERERESTLLYILEDYTILKQFRFS